MSSVNSIKLYDDGRVQFYMLGWEEIEDEGSVQTNQYMLLSGDEVILMDPGGAHVFPRVLANVSEIANINKITHIFYSHQDPDVSSGVILWLSMLNNKVKVHIPGLWVRFLPHFGVYDQSTISPIPDGGGELTLRNGHRLEIIPAHFLHSTGQATLYDPISKVLFSADIGAAVFPPGKRYPIVENFENHVNYMKGFHVRYMASNQACRAWINLIKDKNIDIIAPQHGSVIKGREMIGKFLAWLGNLKCGVDIIDEIYSTGGKKALSSRYR
ncbi:MBL fold metallo-hydrolase [Acetomicrobium sp.]|uniref:MBL fold metallo-hydrolase n=1 Tax=Acetomicrobium sp. TaxID=1872099 RepID=UPI001BCDEAF6|nr:MBL fold metallo-hydrolase [Acetomicrobium sp.]